MRRIVSSDPTTEALGPLLAANPRGLTVAPDEMTKWVMSMDQYKGGRGGDRPFYLSVWAGESVYIDRAKHMKEPIAVPHPFLTIARQSSRTLGGGPTMGSRFEDIPSRIFLDSSALQVLQTYGEFIYENVELSPNDRIHRDPLGIAKLEALRWIMQVTERAPFEFAFSDNSFAEVERRGNLDYLRWAYDVLDHWNACLEASGEPQDDPTALAKIDSSAMNYLGAGDRVLLRDAVLFECDAFLTMENKLPRNADHVRKMIAIRVLSPISMWEILRPWAALFYSAFHSLPDG